MPVVILDRDDLRQLIRERRRTGAYRHDEVWDGVYVMAPDADNQHQKLSGGFVTALNLAVGTLDGFDVYPTINISDRKERWKKNYRIPDVSVFVRGNPAQDCGTHWLGGPDFVVEILSPGDRARKKLSFYAKVGVRELLMVDRRPWRLELCVRHGDAWELLGSSTPDRPDALKSAILPLTFRLLPETPRPQIEVTRSDGLQWLV